jgi:hypothetical protein
MKLYLDWAAAFLVHNVYQWLAFHYTRRATRDSTGMQMTKEPALSGIFSLLHLSNAREHSRRIAAREVYGGPARSSVVAV